MIDWMENHDREKIRILLLIEKKGNTLIEMSSLIPEIIDDFYQDLRRESVDEGKLRIIQTAA